MNNTNKQTGKAGWCRVRMCFSACLCKPVWATELERGWSGWTCSICFGARKHTQNRTQPIPPSHTLAHLSLSLPFGWDVLLICLKLNYKWQLSPNNLFGGFFSSHFLFRSTFLSVQLTESFCQVFLSSSLVSVSLISSPECLSICGGAPVVTFLANLLPLSLSPFSLISSKTHRD